MATLIADLRFAGRLFCRAPAFSVSVIAVLALGIGANAAVFSAVDRVLIRPLPFGRPQRLAMLWEDFSAFGMPKNRVSPATFFDWRRRTRTFADLAAWRVTDVNVTESAAPERVLGAATTANLLPLLGVRPMLGRTMTVDEEGPGHSVVVLSYGLWQRRLAGDPAIVGRAIRMSGERFTVIGVMPRGFHFPDAGTEFWVPIAFRAQQLTGRNSHYLRVIGRLRDDVSWASVREDMTTIARELADEYPASNRGVGITVTPLKEELTGDTSRALTVLLAAAACVLLMTCANVAGLLLARAEHRRREMAIRLALGAGRGRLVRQLLTESLLLSTCGGLAGLIVARWSVKALTGLVPQALAGSVDLDLDGRAVMFATVTTAVTALLFGALPALQLSGRHTGPQDLRTTTSTGGDRRSARSHHALIVGEIAVTFVLVVAASLLVATLARLGGIDPGFRADHVLTADVTVPFPRFADSGRRIAFYRDVIARVRAIPGVAAVGLTSDVPFTSRGNYMSLRVEHQERRGGLGQDALFRLVSAGYLETIGARLRAGRFLDERDGGDATPVVVINATLANQYWPGENALGYRIDTGTGDGAPLWMTIVGIVEDIKERGFDLGPKPAVYVPFTQTTIAFFIPSELAVRTLVPPRNLAAAVLRAVWTVDPEQPVSRIRTLEEIVESELGDRHQTLTLLGALAGLALALSAMGIYGVVSYLVSERRREIGVRLAIGATPGSIVIAMLGQGAVLTVLGIGIGALAAFPTTRLLGSLLFEVSPVDATVLGSVAALLATVTMAASYIPARRASAIDPMLVLRSE